MKQYEPESIEKKYLNNLIFIQNRKPYNKCLNTADTTGELHVSRNQSLQKSKKVQQTTLSSLTTSLPG